MDNSALGYRDRVIEEERELGIRAQKLRDMIATNPIFPKLHLAEQQRLREQLELMLQYQDVLKDRIYHFEHPD